MNVAVKSEVRTYSVYKESGVPWLGHVPEHWQLRRLKGLSQIRTGGRDTIHKKEDGKYPFFIRSQTVERIDTWSYDGEAVLTAGDGAVGEIFHYIDEKFDYHQRVYMFHNFSDILGKFFFHYLRASLHHETSQGTAKSTVESLRLPMLQNFPVTVPPPHEQTAIVRYLDDADQRIRAYVSAKEQLITLLEEAKQAIIHQSVTRGLDPNVKLKPSGVEWLGDVPEHWDRCRLRNVVSRVTTGSRGWSSYGSDTGPLFIRVANLNRGSLELRFDDVLRLNLPETSETGRTRIKPGDLLVSVTAYIGSIGVAPEGFEEAYVSQHVARCEPISGTCSQWLGYVLLSEIGQTHGQMSLYGGTKDGLSLDDVKNYPMLLPPLAEQVATVKYIRKITGDISGAIDHARRQIELMEEYRTRLIADVVTGKLDVREFAGSAK